MATRALLFWVTGFGMAISLSGCGGQAALPDASRCDASGFINQTAGAASNDQLAGIWQWAQQTLATQAIPLNPVSAQEKNIPLTYAAADARAYTVSPDCVAVTAVADTPVASLPPAYKSKGYVDPSGVIPCSSTTGYCHSYTDNHSVWVARSMVLNEGATGWEFQNIILSRLGYNDSGR